MTNATCTRHGLNPVWYEQSVQANAHMVRTDFRIVRHYRRKITRDNLLARGLAEYLKTQRLHPSEIEQWDQALGSGQPLSPDLAQKVALALAEGILKDDCETVDEDTFIGTCGQLLFKWVRSEFYDAETVYASPKLLTDSSTRQGTDYFEILGDPTQASSLYFISWEVKATDQDVTSRTDEIFQMHKRRTPRLLRGLEMQLSLEYPCDKFPVLGYFVRHLLDHWLANSSSKRLGGAVIFDTSRTPRNVFTTFHLQFPELHSPSCRQVLLIEVPRFQKTRKKLWAHLKKQMC